MFFSCIPSTSSTYRSYISSKNDVEIVLKSSCSEDSSNFRILLIILILYFAFKFMFLKGIFNVTDKTLRDVLLSLISRTKSRSEQ
jgi:hypothetical protein